MALFGCSDRDGGELGRIVTPHPPSHDDRTDGSDLAPGIVSPGPARGEPVAVYVVLAGEPAVTAFDNSLPLPLRVAATRKRLREIETEQNQLRSELEARGAVVLSELTRLANALLVSARRETLGEIRNLPGVKRIDPAPTLSPSLASAVPLTGAPRLWERATPVAGDGMRIGIIDSGIDYTHADFGGPGTQAAYRANNPAIIEPGSFPTAKVIGGHDFVGDGYDATNALTRTPLPDPDPLDCERSETMRVAGGHGTHVAGIAAGQGVRSNGTTYTGPYGSSLSPSVFRVSPGVAPRAQLYALKIFGCGGSTNMLAPALERAADPNQDGDFTDRLDVVNASLGTSYGLGSSTDAAIVKNLAAVGTLFVVAAGNDGANFFAVGSPAIYPEALSVAATAESNFVTLRVDSPESLAGDLPASEGRFTERLQDSGPVSGELVLASPSEACGAVSNASELGGKIALVDRGTCAFTVKFQSVVAAGAIAAVVIDNEVRPVPFTMDGSPGSSSIPGVMIRKESGDALKAALANGVSVTLDPAKFGGTGSELIADFSSRGPSSGDSVLKPEVAAPGSAIDSARVASGSFARRQQGTSMACPMVSGAAALVRQARPELSPMEVKAALINGATPVKDPSGAAYPVSIAGAGRIDIVGAVDAPVIARASETDGRGAVSFKPMILAEPGTGTQTVTLTNHGASGVTLNLSTTQSHELPGVTLSVEPKAVVIPPGTTRTAELRLAVDPNALGVPAPDPLTPETQYEQPRHYLSEAGGILRMGAAGTDSAIGLPFYAAVRAASRRKAAPERACRPLAGGPISIPIGGDSAHPKPVTSAFELGVESPTRPDSANDSRRARVDVTAVGTATNFSVRPLAEATVAFGIAVAGDWTTPALGELSPITVLIDADLDNREDFEIRVEALSREGPYADVLSAAVYRVSDATASDARRFINFVPISVADTQPFYNNVLVIPANAVDIGITETDTLIRYSVQTYTNGAEGGDQTAWVEFDAAHPKLDTASGGQEARPLYSGSEPVLVTVDPATTPDALPRLMLLHHTNVADARLELVDLAATLSAEPANLVLTQSGPDAVAAGQSFTTQIVIGNDGPGEIDGVRVELELTGVALESWATPRGTCTITPAACRLGKIAANERVEIGFVGRATRTATSVSIRSTGSVAEGCDVSDSDNAETLEIDVTPEPAPGPRQALAPRGGCGCRTTGGENDSRWLLSGLMLLGLRRRSGSRRS